MATIQATLDVRATVTKALADDCRAVPRITEHSQFVGLFSGDAPSFVKLVAEYAEWSAVVKVSAGVLLTAFLGQLGKDAASDLWKHKRKIAGALASAGASALRALASAFWAAKRLSPSRTYLAAVFQFPDDPLGAVMVVPLQSKEDAALALAVFLDQLEQIETAIRDEVSAGGASFLVCVSFRSQTEASCSPGWMAPRTSRGSTCSR